MVAHSVDHGRGPVKGPQLTGEPARPNTPEQGLFDPAAGRRDTLGAGAG
jgi:hypothetical protein